MVNDCRTRRCVLVLFSNPPDDDKSFRNLVPDIKIAAHPGPWAPVSLVWLTVSVWHLHTLEGFALDLFPAKFGSVPQTSPWFHPLPSSIWNCLTSHCLDFLILPLGFLLVSCMLILKHLNYTSAMSFMLYFQVVKSPVRGSWNLRKYAHKGGKNSRSWLSACLWFCLLCSDCSSTSTSHVRLCNSSISASQYTLCVEI